MNEKTLKKGDVVYILPHINCEINKMGIVQDVDDSTALVTNMNMPFQGTISQRFPFDELKKADGGF